MGPGKWRNKMDWRERETNRKTDIQRERQKPVRQRGTQMYETGQRERETDRQRLYRWVRDGSLLEKLQFFHMLHISCSD